MKQNLHPTWYHNCVVTCACGNTFQTGSTLSSLQVDICNKCHPFFTGELKFVDRQGRVDRFMQKMQTAAQKQAAAQAHQAAKKKAKSPVATTTPAKSYQEILRDQQKQLKKSAPAV